MTRPHSFRQVDITRAIKAARAAGIANPRVMIDTIQRTISIFAREPTNSEVDAQDGAAGSINELDRELEEFKARHGAS